jgi:predicted dehydrogenase
MELSKAYRVGVIGLGNMGARYLEALHANPNYRIIWACDKDPAKLAWARELIHERSRHKLSWGDSDGDKAGAVYKKRR